MKLIFITEDELPRIRSNKSAKKLQGDLENYTMFRMNCDLSYQTYV